MTLAKRFLVLSPIFPPDRYGGIEIIAYELACAVSQAGHEVIVAAVGRSLDNPIDDQRFRVLRIPGGFSSKDEIEKTNETAFESLAQLIDEFDVIHCHDWFFLKTCLALKRIKPVLKLQVIVHLCKKLEYSVIKDTNEVLHTHIMQLQEDMVAAADLVLTYSDFMRRFVEELWQFDSNRIAEFYCGMKPNFSSVDARYARLSESPVLRVLYLGRLAPEKDVGTLLRACGQLKQRISFSLQIVGSGRDETYLRHLSCEVGIDEFTSWAPFSQASNVVVEYLRWADVLVLPSIYEPFGMILLEAMSESLPIITVNHGGPSEIVEQFETGLTFTPGDFLELSKMIEEVVRDRIAALRRAQKAIEMSARKYSWRLAADMLISHSDR